MPVARKRIAADGRPARCAVRINPEVSAALYRERLDGHFRDETELVNAILRDWVKTVAPIDWPSIKARLENEVSC